MYILSYQKPDKNLINLNSASDDDVQFLREKLELPEDDVFEIVRPEGTYIFQKLVPISYVGLDFLINTEKNNVN